MPRTSITNEFTTNVINEIGVLQGIDTCIASGNTVKIKLASGFEFAFSPRTISGIAVGESKYSKESCIGSLARFIAETGIQSSSKYSSWVKSPEIKDAKDSEGNSIKTPNTHAIMLTLGVWPAQTITKLLLQGKLSETSPDDIIAMQIAYNEKLKSDKSSPIETETTVA